MKKIILFISCALALFVATSVIAPSKAKAQRFVPAASVSKAAIVNTDTAVIIFNPTGDVKSFHVHAAKDTGTISGKIVLYGYNNKVYKPIDSASFTASSLYSGGILSYSFPARASNGDMLYSSYKIIFCESVMGRVKTITAEALIRN